MEIRDVRYQGNAYWEYCIEASSRPLVESVYPLAVNPGKAESLEPIGHLLAADARVDWTLANDRPLGLDVVQLPLGGEPSNPVALIATDLPLAGESLQANDAAEDGQELAVPGGLNGRIEREADIDYYAFEAKKGEAYTLEVIARRAASALEDPHIAVLKHAVSFARLRVEPDVVAQAGTAASLHAYTQPALLRRDVLFCHRRADPRQRPFRHLDPLAGTPAALRSLASAVWFNHRCARILVHIRHIQKLPSDSPSRVLTGGGQPPSMMTVTLSSNDCHLEQ